MDLENNEPEVLSPTEKIDTFEITDDMPEELKQKLEKFNRQTNNLNRVIDGMNVSRNQDSEVGNLMDEISNDLEEEEDLIEEDGSIDGMKDLF